MRTSARSTPVNIILLFGSLIVFFGGGEVLLRATGIEKGHPAPPQIFQKSKDPQIGYELRPSIKETAYRNIVTTNHLGFRAPELNKDKSTIAVLGDSITFGYGVADNETLPARMSSLLGEKDNVLNTGVPGYNLIQEIATYDQKVRTFKPSAVILVFYWNDLQDMDPGTVDAEGNLHPADWKPSPVTCNPINTGILGLLPGRCWLDLHSAFYRTVKKIVSANTERQNLAMQEVEFKKHPEEDSVQQEKLDRYIREFNAFARTLPESMPKIFVIWPEKELHAPTRPKLRALAESNGFRVVDLYDTFGNQAETLSWDTVHPSAATLAKAADEIGKALQQSEATLKAAQDAPAE